jgi:thiol:disulfide interchange protein
MSTLKFFLLGLWLVLGLPHRSRAQLEQPVSWHFRASPATPASETTLTFTALIQGQWHIYSQHMAAGGPVPTQFAFAPSARYQLLGPVREATNPVKAFEESFQLTVAYFPKRAVFQQKVKLGARPTTVKGVLTYMTCNDLQCLPPEEIAFSIAVPAAASHASPLVPPARASSAKLPSGLRHVAPHAPAAHRLPNRAPAAVPASTSAARGGAHPAPQPLGVIFLAGFLGGLAALLMPCIFPMLPLTVSYFTKQHASRRRAVGGAAFYGLCIVGIYVGLGLLVTVLFGADALNSLATNGLFNLGFFGLLLVFAASLLGAFELTLPSAWVSRADTQADKGGLVGIFFMAATLALVSFSCTGPIIGTLLVQAASSGQLLGPALGMLGFSVALALPFTLFALFPAGLAALPKSGGWLHSVKVVLGFLELALALKFLSNVDLAYHWEWFDRELFLALWVIIFALLGFYLLGKLRFAHDSQVSFLSLPRLLLAILALAFTAYLVPGLWGAPLKAVAAFLPPQYTQDFDLYTASLPSAMGAAASAASHPACKYNQLFRAPLKLDAFFDYEEAAAYARQVHKPLLVDFTGHACVNCRKMEASVWADPQVLARLRQDYVLVQLYVDDKTELPATEQTVSALSGKTIKTIGSKWSDFQATRYQANSQPYYVLLDPATGRPLAPAQGADYTASRFETFLTQGLSAYQQAKAVALR